MADTITDLIDIEMEQAHKAESAATTPEGFEIETITSESQPGSGEIQSQSITPEPQTGLGDIFANIQEYLQSIGEYYTAPEHFYEALATGAGAIAGPLMPIVTPWILGKLNTSLGNVAAHFSPWIIPLALTYQHGHGVVEYTASVVAKKATSAAYESSYGSVVSTLDVLILNNCDRVILALETVATRDSGEELRFGAESVYRQLSDHVGISVFDERGYTEDLQLVDVRSGEKVPATQYNAGKYSVLSKEDQLALKAMNIDQQKHAEIIEKDIIPIIKDVETSAEEIQDLLKQQKQHKAYLEKISKKSGGWISAKWNPLLSVLDAAAYAYFYITQATQGASLLAPVGQYLDQQYRDPNFSLLEAMQAPFSHICFDLNSLMEAPIKLGYAIGHNIAYYLPSSNSTASSEL